MPKKDPETLARETFGQRLRELRYERNMSQAALARCVDVHVVTISRLETGRYAPDWWTVVRLAEALGASLGDFGPEKKTEKGE